MKVVADMDDPDYFELRAIESIMEARTITPSDENKIRQAVSLLLLSLVKRANSIAEKERAS